VPVYLSQEIGFSAPIVQVAVAAGKRCNTVCGVAKIKTAKLRHLILLSRVHTLSTPVEILFLNGHF
jgi:hypothetical protein